MTFATVTLNGPTYQRPDGELARGFVSIRPTVAKVYDDAGNVVISGTVKVPLVAGTFTIDLPATDDPNLSPSGYGYRLTEHLTHAGTGTALSFLLPTTPSTVDLLDVVEIDPSSPEAVAWRDSFRTEMEAVLDDAIQITGIDDTDAAVAALVETPAGPLTQAALSATYAPASGSVNYAPASSGYPRRQRLRPRPQETVISTMGAGHGWTSSGTWTSMNLNDTTDTAWDNQVITGVTPGTGAGLFLTKSGLTAFDPTGTYFVVMVKAAVPSRIANLQMYVEDGSANKHLLNAFFNGGQLKPNEWMPVIFSFDGATVLGTGIGTAATQVSFRVADVNGSGGTTIKFGGISRVMPSPAYPNGVVSFTFDDAWASHYTIARPVLNKYRYRATEYPILDLIGTAGRLTLQNIYDLSLLNGWEIGGHATSLATHTTGLVAMTAAQRTAELRAVKKWIMDNGLQGDSLAYPGGNYDTATSNEVRAMFSAARTTDASPKETLPAADVTRLRSKSIGATDSLASLQTLVDQAYTYKHHLIFTIHDIVASGASGSTQMNTATLSGLVDYCATKGIPVRTIDEVTANV